MQVQNSIPTQSALSTPSAPSTLCFDIGGTKIAYGIVHDNSPTETIAAGSVPAQPQGSSLTAEFDKAVGIALAAAREAGIEPDRIGVGAPGIVRGPSGTILRSGPTVPGWQGTIIEDIIARHTNVPVACHNDVRIWAFGEHNFGAGRGITGRVIYLSLGTGVGGAIVDNGELQTGTSGSTGEFSELLVADLRGMAERVENTCSGNSLARYYNVLAADADYAGRIAWDHPAGPDDLSLPEIMKRYHAGDRLAFDVIDGNMRGFGRALAGLAFALDIDGIIIGGGVGGLGEPILGALRAGFAQWTVDSAQRLPIADSELGRLAPLIGAAAYAREYAE
ncbi:ROK family protein [Corynebacterium pseudodiphtheriticum]|uniref:ROK family protein n=1 Tax=Corynebacterium pseudodiphtheriticum TaxID=37637 RepID=UPI0025437C6D|nr:ROK family protein [Corynebacterium pseudodiphtheriticum]MDK4236345.1 ROK family protein [Corynebacterium pseudodiphtheriticum]